jgi:V-type H+-transporting ATPase subunit a
MMFGDMGHGSVLFFIATILVLFAKKIRSPKTNGILSARYLLLLMGMMSTFAGLIYNEYFAIPTNIFGSCYEMNKPIPLNQMTGNATIASNATKAASHSKNNMIYWRRASNKCVYPFGQDPVWSAATNKLTLVNSIKMKMSVIFGVLHMSFGIMCKGTNMIYKRKYMELLTEVFAGFVILWGLFGWMDALIFVKFFKTHDIDDCSKIENGRCIGELQNEKTPGIIAIIITTVFAFGNYDKKKQREPLIGSS